MKRTLGALLTLGVCALALADAPTPPASTAGAQTESTAATLKRLERDWTIAMQTGDAERIGGILGDDWVEVSGDGRKVTKERLLAGIKSGRVKVESIELGPLDVKVLGDVAVVQGSHVEKSTTNGERTSVEVIWMDVLANRSGKWVVVRSQSSARSEEASRPRWPI
jgi:ketosteroid isomerase-like protein